MDHLSQQQQIDEAKQLARAHGLFFSEKKVGTHTNYLLFRRTRTGNVFLGKRSSPTGLRCFVSKAASVRRAGDPS